MVANEPPKYEPSRYDESAPFYRSGRLTYSPVLIQHAAEVSKLGPQSTVLDLGCGPGSIANEIAEFSGHVIGVDPSEAMLVAAREVAPPNVNYIQGSSFDLSFIDRPLALVTFGRSFHWMDRKATIETLDRSIQPGGCLAIFSVNPMVKAGAAHAWLDAVNKTMKKFAELNAEEKQMFGGDWERNEFLLARSAFSDLTDLGVVSWHSWTFKNVLDLVLSRFNAGRDQLNNRLPDIEAALKETLEPYGAGPWKTLNQHRIIIARRPGDL